MVYLCSVERDSTLCFCFTLKLYAMNDSMPLVPEIDAASVPPEAVASAEVKAPDVVPREQAALSPEQAMQLLPASLAEHIRGLIDQAEAEGYLRGRNEAIEATQTFDHRAPSAPEQPEPTFPRYCRRSIWD